MRKMVKALIMNIKRMDLYPYKLLLPSIFFISLVLLYPIIRTINLSFYYYKLTEPRNIHFIGLKNYFDALSSSNVWNGIKIALLYCFGSVVGSYIIGLLVSLVLNLKSKFRGLFRSIIIIPWAVPEISTAIVFSWILDYQFGVLNFILRSLGIIEKNIGWLTDTRLALFSVTMATVWKMFPLASIMILAGLQTISEEQYEAAEIDGANYLQKLFYITLPSIKSISQILLILLTVWSFRKFNIIYLMTAGGPAQSTETIVIQTYYEAFRYFNFGYASAIGVITLLISLFITTMYFRLITLSKD